MSALRCTAAKVLATVLAAAVVGVVSVRPLLRGVMDAQAIHNGPWRTAAATGSSEASAYVQAAVAVAGLYALTPREAIYFTAFSDGSGQPLRGECRYRISGRAPPARWWSLTVYGADHYLVANDGHRYARHAGNVPLDADGHFALRLSSAAGDSAALPTPDTGPFSVTLRLYNPAPGTSEQLGRLTLPQITREHCP